VTCTVRRSIIRIMKSITLRLEGYVTRIGKKRNVYIYIYIYIYMLLVEKPVGKRQLGRHRRRWVYNIRMDFAR
jgi:hypothetical protein